MAYSDHVLRFRLMSNDDLLAKKDALEQQDSIFSQQAQGTRSAMRDLRYLADQLNAIAYVMAERGMTCVIKAPFNNSVGVTDFSAVGTPDTTRPAGTSENL